MPYEITYTERRIARLTWSDNEQQSAEWKKGAIDDKISITPSGRNVKSTPFRKNVTYKIFDHAVHQTRKIPMEVVIICDPSDNKGVALDFEISQLKERRYQMRVSAQETFNAIVLADIEYSKHGGGVMYNKLPLHKNEELKKRLFERLTQIQKNKR